MNLKEKILKELKPATLLTSGVKAELESRGGLPKFPIVALPTLNKKAWGLRSGLNIIAARTSNAKSSFLLQLEWELSKSMPVLHLSLEDDTDEIVERLFCQDMEIDNYHMLCGMFNTNQEYRDRFEVFKEHIKERKLLLSCRIGETFNEINVLIENLNPKPRVVSLDYIQAIKTSRNEREEMNEYIRRFREICLKNDICGIIVSQINRTGVNDDGGEPELHHLKSTGVLEEHADLCMLLHWPYQRTKKEEDINKFKINLAKNKKGRTGRITVKYEPQFYKFSEAEVEWTHHEKGMIQSVFPGARQNET